jgi:hypothetical protein
MRARILVATPRADKLARCNYRKLGPTMTDARAFPRRAVLLAFAAAVIAVPIAVGRAPCDPPEAVAKAAAADPLVGLWSAHPSGAEGEPVQFYYFHGGGHGLYRYGRVGSTFTNSFDYAVGGDVVTLSFRKSGAAHGVHFRITEESGASVLELADDPRGGGSRRYVQVRSEPIDPHIEPVAGDAGLGGRMWLDRTGYATGGYGFSLYQLRAAGIDGRGTGWFHRGDFDDWSTESLVYRTSGDRLELEFHGGDGSELTRFAVVPGEPRTLVLEHDPRDWWHPHRYLDAGPSFGAVESWIVDTAVLDSAARRVARQ